MTKKRTPPFPAEVRERAVRMVLEQEGEYPTQWASISSAADKIGCLGETPL
jgi:transposase